MYFKIIKLWNWNWINNGKKNIFTGLYLYLWYFVYLVWYFVVFCVCCVVLRSMLFRSQVYSEKKYFLVSALLRDCSLCWDRWNGTWHLHLTRPCLLALGWVLIYISDTHLGRFKSQSNSMNIAGPLWYHKLHASSGIRSTWREVATVFEHCRHFTP